MTVAVPVSNRDDRLFGRCLGWFVSFDAFNWFDTPPSRGRSTRFCFPLRGFEALAPGLPGLSARLRFGFRPRSPRPRPDRTALARGTVRLSQLSSPRRVGPASLFTPLVPVRPVSPASLLSSASLLSPVGPLSSARLLNSIGPLRPVGPANSPSPVNPVGPANSLRWGSRFRRVGRVSAGDAADRAGRGVVTVEPAAGQIAGHGAILPQPA
ncbi:hypothetical protein YIM_17490 [Amycolatopsis sp. YIM 10]|nr:hypothetical protein YIM_17490 [Amycolatopsis sp. YIM 10]